MDANELESVLCELLEEHLEDLRPPRGNRRRSTWVSTFKELGMLTDDAGLVVRTEDGSEFQIIVRSR